jgi:beta-xylosidase
MHRITRHYYIRATLLVIGMVLLSSCATCATSSTVEATAVETSTVKPTAVEQSTVDPTVEPTAVEASTAEPIQIRMKEPLITNMYTADPSAHVFEGKLYIYPSHDLDNDTPPSMEGDQYDMEDYHVFSLDDMQSPVIDHGQVLHVDDVPWAQKQMWAPDAAFKNDTYYFYFPAKDKDGIFRIGVASGTSPAGPFTPEPEPIPGSFSMDPCVFVDDDGQAYMYFGGLWGGQLERWRTGTYDPEGTEPQGSEPALGPRVARMADDMKSFDGPVEEVIITDEDGNPLLAKNHAQRFFEGSWLHKYNGTYYLSYSTGNTHYIVYATSDSPTGPFVYRGRILNPVSGWTTHHSIVEFQGKWYLFYHDDSLSGVDHKRNIKVAEIVYEADGSIQTTDP